MFKKTLITLIILMALIGLSVNLVGKAREKSVNSEIRACVISADGSERKSSVSVQGRFLDYLPFQGDDQLNFENPMDGLYLNGNRMPIDVLPFPSGSRYGSCASGDNIVYIEKNGRFVCVLFTSSGSMLVAPARNSNEAQLKLRSFLEQNQKLPVQKVEAIEKYLK